MKKEKSSNLVKKKNSSMTIKKKLLLGFSLIILALSLLNIISIVTTSNAISKLDDMLETILLVNDIADDAKKIVAPLRQYLLNKKVEDKQEVATIFEKTDERFKVLDKIIKNDDSQAALSGIRGIRETLGKTSDETIKFIEAKKSSDAVNNIDEIKKLIEFVENNVKELISIELRNGKSTKERLTKNNSKLRISIFSLVASICILSFISVFIFSNSLVKPLNHVSNILKNIAVGEGDLTQKLTVKSKDEVGILSTHFNDFIASLSVMIGRIKKVAEKTTAIGSNLASSSEESTASLEEIRVNVENMKNKINYLDGEISSSTSLSNEVKNFISNLVSLVDTQSSAIHESSSSVEEMLSSIKSLANTTEEKYETSNKLYIVAENGEKLMGETIDVIKKIANSANIIMDLLKVINNTASQTNLLAMNAAIEAAHSGEYGKGFSVVADEIRKFAEETRLNSKEMSKSLKELINYMGISEESTSKTNSIFKEMVSGIKEVSNSMIEMKNAMRELSVGSEQIMQALASLVKVTEEVKVSYSDIDKNILSINESLNNVSMISTDTRNGMEEVTLGIAELYKTAKIISETGSSNIENISELDSLINKFKIEN